MKYVRELIDSKMYYEEIQKGIKTIDKIHKFFKNKAIEIKQDQYVNDLIAYFKKNSNQFNLDVINDNKALILYAEVRAQICTLRYKLWEKSPKLYDELISQITMTELEYTYLILSEKIPLLSYPN